MDLKESTLAPGASTGERIKVLTLPAIDSMTCTIHHGPFVTTFEAYNALGQ